MRVAIVDDEKIECEAMSYLLKQSDIPVQIVYEANNGRDAVNLFEVHRPDLLIIDIQMPQMSGLEALREINRRFGSVYAIILSAYDEFSYAQEALRLGAVDYLLKPCNTGKLYRAIARVAEKLDEKKRNIRLNVRTDKILAEIEQYAKRELLDYMIAGAFRADWVEDYITHGNNWKGLRYHCVIVRIPDMDYPRLRELSLSHMPEDKGTELVFRLIERSLVCLFLVKRGCTFELNRFVELTASQLPEQDKKKIQVSGGNGTSDYSVLPQMYQQAEEALYQAYYQNETYHRRILDLYELENLLMAAILRNNPSEAYECLVQIAQQVEKSDSNLVQKRGYCAYLWRQIDRKLFQSLGRRRTTEKKQQMDYKIGQLQDIKEMIPLFCSFIQDYLHILKVNQESEVNKVIEVVKECIQTQLAEDISLESVADQVGFSAPYLSKLFKRIEGVNFKKYLVSLRMETAKKLLADNMTIVEVAEKVGYPNADYFSTVFKNYYGFTASEYRKKGMNKKE